MKASSAITAKGSLNALVLMALVLADGCSTFSSKEAPFAAQTINFDSTDGKLPPDFSTALTGGGGPAAWVIRKNPAPPDATPVLVQESSDDTSYRFPMCIYDKLVARDVAVEVNYQAIAGKVDQAGGIVLRYSPENYYIARANALEDNIDLFKTVNGKRLKIQEVNAKVAGNQWHSLRFEAKGPHLKVSFDGKVIIEANDATFSRPGKIGLWTKADSISAFADLKVEPAK